MMATITCSSQLALMRTFGRIRGNLHCSARNTSSIVSYKSINCKACNPSCRTEQLNHSVPKLHHNGCGSITARKVQSLAQRYQNLSPPNILTGTISQQRSIFTDACSKWADRVAAKQSCQSRMYSLLYVKHVEGSLSIVEVDLDLDTRLHDISNLHKNLVDRDMDINAYQLASRFHQLKHMGEQKSALEEERVAIAKKMKFLVKDAVLTACEDLNQEKKLLIDRGKEVREELRSVSKDYYALEEEIILTGLKLPVHIHASTPRKDVVLEEMGQKPEFSPTQKIRSHMAIGKLTGILSFDAISPGAYYLTDELALLEQDLLYSASQKLRQLGLQQFSCPDMVKPVVLAGCGLDEHAPKKVFQLDDQEFSDEESSSDEEDVSHRTLHLTGASPFVFAAYLTKSNIADSSLPIKAFSAGRNYNADNTDESSWQTGLFGVPQANVVELFGAAGNEVQCADLYEEFFSDVRSFYQELDLPVRFSRIGPRGLDYMEAAKVKVEIWSPSVDDYIKVGQVAMWGDFLSRRLVAKHAENVENHTNRNYIHTVHGTLVNIPVLLGALMELHQTTDGRCQLPEALLKKLSGNKT